MAGMGGTLLLVVMHIITTFPGFSWDEIAGSVLKGCWKVIA